tara:strand:- start:2091 stop:2531 length:441 start_codon:yes stop_codon:yes gene_type:complete
VYTKTRKPKGYFPYEKLIICSNTLLGGGLAFEVSGQIPLWIGKGEKPKVWLSSISFTGKSLPLVEKSKPAVANISSFEEDGATGFAINGEVILRIENYSKDKCEVTKMNLFPIGLPVKGDKFGLEIGGSTFSRNTFNGAAVMFGLG